MNWASKELVCMQEGRISSSRRQKPSCDGLDLASQGWRQAGARTDEEDFPISCGQFFLTLRLFFFILNLFRSKFLLLLSPPLKVFLLTADSKSTKGSDGCREHKSLKPFGAVFIWIFDRDKIRGNKEVVTTRRG